MDNLTFGLIMVVVGMGGTVLALGVMAALLGALTRFLRAIEKEEKP